MRAPGRVGPLPNDVRAARGACGTVLRGRRARRSRRTQRLIGVCALDVADGQITSINGIVNPDKLKHLGPVADFKALLRSAS